MESLLAVKEMRGKTENNITPELFKLLPDGRILKRHSMAFWVLKILPLTTKCNYLTLNS